MKQLIERVKHWSESKGIIESANLQAQLAYVLFETCEAWQEYVKQRYDRLPCEIGDVYVTLINLSLIIGLDVDEILDYTQMPPVEDNVGDLFQRLAQTIITRKAQRYADVYTCIGSSFQLIASVCNVLDIEPGDCLEQAVDKIERRTGRTVDGVFIKDGEHG